MSQTLIIAANVWLDDCLCAFLLAFALLYPFLIGESMFEEEENCEEEVKE